jgi:hypothetical protein
MKIQYDQTEISGLRLPGAEIFSKAKRILEKKISSAVGLVVYRSLRASR